MTAEIADKIKKSVDPLDDGKDDHIEIIVSEMRLFFKEGVGRYLASKLV